MLIVTNRKINESNFVNGVGDHNAFGDKVNVKGPNEVRLAHAEKVDKKWRVRLVDEPEEITNDNIPSRKIFDETKERLVKEKKNCVFFVHGFDQSFQKNLDKAWEIEKAYEVEVIAFSWSSNPGGLPLPIIGHIAEYRRAQRIAEASVGALDATLEKLGAYLKELSNKEVLEKCGVKFTFMAHSLGNFLFENYVRNVKYEGETNIFDNVVLCQADVDNKGHAEWADQIKAGKRVYVTINEDDWALRWSDKIQVDRLGNTAKNLNSSNALYFDFTDGEGVDDTHELFYKKTNSVVEKFFNEVLNGRRGENKISMVFDSQKNAYRF